MRLSAHGRWPGPLTLRRGWCRAEARPWNAEIGDAQLRLLRGGGGFLEGCARYLLEAGAPAVVSPPLSQEGRGVWLAGGFQPFLYLDLWRRELASVPAGPSIPARRWPSADLAPLLDLDRAAFGPRWRLDRPGLEEALAVTPRAELLIVPVGRRPVGYAVVGGGGPFAYLQRIAVHPDARRGGVGRALLRHSLHLGRRWGARAMLLNTQPDNLPAARLYRSEGFTRQPARLALMRAA